MKFLNAKRGSIRLQLNFLEGIIRQVCCTPVCCTLMLYYVGIFLRSNKNIAPLGKPWKLSFIVEGLGTFLLKAISFNIKY